MSGYPMQYHFICSTFVLLQGEFVVHAAMTPLKEDNPGGLMNEDDKDYILDHAEHVRFNGEHA